MARRKSILNSLMRVAIREAVKSSKKKQKQRRSSTNNNSVTRSDHPRPRSANAQRAKNNVTHRDYYRQPREIVRLQPRGIKAFPINGESFYADNFSKVRRSLGADEEVFTDVILVHDPTNPKDSNAVAVTVNGHVLGHVPAVVSQGVASFLRGRGGVCEARIYFDDFGGYNSVQLDIEYPPLPVGTERPRNQKAPFVGGGNPRFDQGDLSTHRFELHRLKVPPGGVHYGVALLHEGFREKPLVQDEETLQYIARPYEKISYSFNLFARAHGGVVRVRYQLKMGFDGKHEVLLDSSGLPEFHKKKY